jgi:hypothetical protein
MISPSGEIERAQTVTLDCRFVRLDSSTHTGYPSTASRPEDQMQDGQNNPFSLDEAITEIATILARGYMSHRKGQRIAPDSEAQAVHPKKPEEPAPYTEKRLDCSGHQSPHAFTG